jgi:hypothetical protein
MVRQRAATRQQPKRGIARWWRVGTLVLLSCTAYDSDALDRLILEVAQISSPSVQATGATVALDVTGPSPPRVEARLAQLRLPALGLSYSDLDVACTGVIVEQPHFACTEGTLAARGAPIGRVSMRAAAAYDSSSGALSFNGSGLSVAGADTRFAGRLQPGAWSLSLDADHLDLVAARKLATPWLQLPDTESLSGHVKLQVDATGQLHTPGRAAAVRARMTAHTSDLDFSNQPGTTVGQKLTVSVTGSANRRAGQLTSDLEVQSTAGQALAGLVLLDFGLNPLDLHAHVETAAAALAVTARRTSAVHPAVGQRLSITGIHITQKDLIEAQGQAQVTLGGPIRVTQAHVDIQRLEFAAAYRSFLQLALATTDFGALNFGGHATGEIDMANDTVQKVNASLENVSAADSTTRLSLANANGEVHWVADANAAVDPSHLSWSSSSAYGLIGGAVRVGFTTRGKNFAFGGDTRFPIFDGALVVHKLAVRRLGATDAELDFDAHLEPISMPSLSKAFGWPVLSGQLAGRIPGVTYRDHVLTVEGDLIANVFDGTIVGSRLKLRDPLGPWPRLDADVSARRLDLDLVTHTFSIGSITGRMDADIRGLELFSWSPVAFDARLHTTPRDRSEHLISQKAITSISSVGGGGGSVAAALQSGVLKFFHKFHYDRIGISCQLRDEVCLMSGIEPARNGYYMVKGRGIPRIDIIGSAGRVNWPQLVGQITAGMHSQNIMVR